MRGLAAVAALAAALAPLGAAGAEREALSFAVGEERYVVPEDGLASVEAVLEEGLRLCPTPEVERALADLTGRHRGEVVTVSIGDRPVFHLEIAEPYASGCLGWPMPPRLAAVYRGRLTGEASPGETSAGGAGE